MTTAFLGLVNHARHMRPEEVRGQIKGNSVEGQKEKIDRQRQNENQSSSKSSPKKIQEKKIWHKKLLTASFYSDFGQRTEHLIKGWNVCISHRHQHTQMGHDPSNCCQCFVCLHACRHHEGQIHPWCNRIKKSVKLHQK